MTLGPRRIALGSSRTRKWGGAGPNHTGTTTYLSACCSSRRCRPCWLSSSREQVELLFVWAGRCRRRRERVLRMMIMMRRTGLLVKTRPTKASSTKTRQHSGAHTLRECTHALRGHKDGGRIQKQANIVSSRRHHRCLKEATLRRCSRGGSSMRTRMKKATNLHTFGN